MRQFKGVIRPVALPRAVSRVARHPIFWLSRVAKGLWAARQGTAAVEFALASWPLMMLLLASVAINSVFTVMTGMQANAQYAARLMSTGQAASNVNGTITTSNLSSTSVSCTDGRVTSGKAEYY